MGFTVSGSDQRLTTPRELAQHGAVDLPRAPGRAHRGRTTWCSSPRQCQKTTRRSTAAAAQGIPVVKRADFLGPLMEGQHGIGVAGSHGKTTTTSLIAIILMRAGMDPSFIVGRPRASRASRRDGQHHRRRARGRAPSSSKPTSTTACSWACAWRWRWSPTSSGITWTAIRRRRRSRTHSGPSSASCRRGACC